MKAATATLKPKAADTRVVTFGVGVFTEPHMVEEYGAQGWRDMHPFKTAEEAVDTAKAWASDNEATYHGHVIRTD